ncbi:hypothetical protein, partial [Kitasatospora sp. NPDC007106]|uniref:hypothetical protein n=1 Tax=Kitasatospora sp. NPDC007106 TaxID=3156914 RepID=UPI0033D8965B
TPGVVTGRPRLQVSAVPLEGTRQLAVEWTVNGGRTAGLAADVLPPPPRGHCVSSTEEPGRWTAERVARAARAVVAALVDDREAVRPPHRT